MHSDDRDTEGSTFRTEHRFGIFGAQIPVDTSRENTRESSSGCV